MPSLRRRLGRGLAADLTGDCDVEAFDLAILLGSWGPCPSRLKPTAAPGPNIRVLSPPVKSRGFCRLPAQESHGLGRPVGGGNANPVRARWLQPGWSSGSNRRPLACLETRQSTGVFEPWSRTVAGPRPSRCPATRAARVPERGSVCRICPSGVPAAIPCPSWYQVATGNIKCLPGRSKRS